MKKPTRDNDLTGNFVKLHLAVDLPQDTVESEHLYSKPRCNPKGFLRSSVLKNRTPSVCLSTVVMKLVVVPRK